MTKNCQKQQKIANVKLLQKTSFLFKVNLYLKIIFRKIKILKLFLKFTQILCVGNNFYYV